jgi:hypothetical protein
MQKGKTLWQMWTEPKPKPLDFYNPINAKIGSIIIIDDIIDGIDLHKCDFALESIEEFTRTIEGQTFKFTDYLIRDRGSPEVVRVRVNPADPNVSVVPHNVLILRLDDEFAFSDDFLAVVNDTTKKFIVTDDKSGASEEYWRINDVSAPYKCSVVAIKTTNADGSVDEKSATRSNCEYWDYWRQTKDEAGQDFNQFVFVHQNSENGWFQIFKGREIDPQMITVL